MRAGRVREARRGLGRRVAAGELLVAIATHRRGGELRAAQPQAGAREAEVELRARPVLAANLQRALRCVHARARAVLVVAHP